jgi:integrase
MEMMGHADYSITANRYQHVPDELQRLAADRIDALLGGLDGGAATSVGGV